MKVKGAVEVDLTVEIVAQFFAGLDDEQQADFFIKVAELAQEWRTESRSFLGVDYQWNKVGAHLRSCSCATPEAQQMIKALHDGLTETHWERKLEQLWQGLGQRRKGEQRR